MLSLYIHIPFCEKKCGYCSFHVLATEGENQASKLIVGYVDAVCEEIRLRWERVMLADPNGNKWELKTIYFGGGTPLQIGTEQLCRIIDTIEEVFDTENLGELWIECNPYPQDLVYETIRTIHKRYKHFPRIRRSFGIQTFDTEVLKESDRMYSFPAIKDFLRWLVDLKADNSVFNFDFIAFGKFNTTKKWERILRDTYKRDFLVDFVSSYFADGFSLYTLELFPWSTRYHEQILQHSHAKDGLPLKKYGTDDDVYAEFWFIKTLFQENGYRRYELSNFALPGKASIHNNVYRNMENYIGVGTSASSFIDFAMMPDLRRHITTDEQARSARRTNTKVIGEYIKGNALDLKTLENMTEQDYRIEKVFLALRTQAGVEGISEYADLFVSDREKKIIAWQQDDLVDYYDDIFVLKDKGMDVYNTIITDLFAKL